jgi:hypothetical protein
MNKRIISIVVACLLLLGLMASCTTTPTTTTTTAKPSGTTTTKPGTTATTTASDIKYDISFFANMPTENDTYVEQLIEEALNINLTIPLINWQDAEKYNLMFSSGEMPDCGFFTKDTQYLIYDHELARTFPLEMINTYAPSFAKLYDDNPLFWAYVINREDPDQANGLPAVSETFPELYLWVDFYRYDWIQDLGLDLGTEVVKSEDNFYLAEGAVPLANYEAILRAFKSKGTDIIPATWNGGFHQTMLSAFGLTPDIVDNNGQADQFYVTDRYKELLTWAASMYAEGLFDKEIPTQDRAVWWDKVNNGQAGWFPQSSNALNNWAIQRPPLSVWTKDPTIPILMTPGIADANGKYISQDYVAAKCNSHMFFVNAKVTDEGKLARILQLVEYISFPQDVESYATFIYGKKDVDWKWAEDRKDWPVKINPQDVQPNGGGYFLSQMQVYEFWKWLTLEPLFEKGGKYYVKGMGGVWNQHKVYPYVTDILNETNIIKVNTDYAANVNTVVAEFRNEILTGTIQMTDATWAKYLNDLNTAGYSAMHDEYQKMRKTAELLAEYGG